MRTRRRTIAVVILSLLAVPFQAQAQGQFASLYTPPFGVIGYYAGFSLDCSILNIGTQERVVGIDIIRANGANAGQSILGSPVEFTLPPGNGAGITEGGSPGSSAGLRLYCRFFVEGSAEEYVATGCVGQYQVWEGTRTELHSGCVPAKASRPVYSGVPHPVPPVPGP